MFNAPSPDPLDVVAAYFSQWGDGRRAPGEHVPGQLRTIACQVLETESLDSVVQACSVALATLGRWRNDRRAAMRTDVRRHGQPMTSTFVALPARVGIAALPSQSDARIVLAPTLITKRPDGLRLHLHGRLNVARLAELRDGAAR